MSVKFTTDKKLAIACFFGLAFLGWVISTGNHSGGETGARTACMASTLTRLHDPGSAEFADPVVLTSNGGYQVMLTVRARNGFNALRSSSVTCEVSSAGRVTNIVGP